MALWDLENSDCIIAMGSNLAENHPIGFRFVVEAQRRGATVIHVDPRFTGRQRSPTCTLPSVRAATSYSSEA